MPDPTPPPKKAGKLPVWAYAVAAVLGILLVYFLSRPSKQAKATNEGGLSPDMAAAQAGQPSQFFGGFDQPDSVDAGPGGNDGSHGNAGPATYRCRNNNRECPTGMHCHNATGTCVPHPNEDPENVPRHCGKPGMPPCVTA